VYCHAGVCASAGGRPGMGMAEERPRLELKSGLKIE
jgi:hypothetical protein